MKHIIQTNVHKYVGLPDNSNLSEFTRIYKIFENNIEQMPSPIVMIVSLMDSEKQVYFLQFNRKSYRIYVSNDD
jgi:hypothetical protein